MRLSGRQWTILSDAYKSHLAQQWLILRYDRDAAKRLADRGLLKNQGRDTWQITLQGIAVIRNYLKMTDPVQAQVDLAKWNKAVSGKSELE